MVINKNEELRRIINVGNSVGITMSSWLMRDAGFKVGDLVKIEISEHRGKIIITKVKLGDWESNNVLQN